jgi:hypothetical protein
LDFEEEWREECDLDLLSTLFLRPNGEKFGQKLKQFSAFGWFRHAEDLGLSYASTPMFQNLDCLTLREVEDAELFELLARCQSLRIRKFRLEARGWHNARDIIGNGQLELLHIRLKCRGLKYEELIPLIVKSGSKLQSLRLELVPYARRSSGNEGLSHDLAKELFIKCSKLRHLCLHVDFDGGAWVSNERPPARAGFDVH